MSIPYILFVFNVPAGVGVYYIIFNFLAIVQTMIVAKFYSSHILTAKEEAARIALLDMEEKMFQKDSKFKCLYIFGGACFDKRSFWSRRNDKFSTRGRTQKFSIK